VARIVDLFGPVRGVEFPRMPAPKRTKDVEIPIALIDAFGEAKKLHDEFAPTEAQYQKLYRELKGVSDTMDATDGGFFDGETFTLEISERGMSKDVDVAAARKKLGANVFLTVVSITQSALNAILPKPAVEALLIETQTGSRTS
jgi:hypothetical protein